MHTRIRFTALAGLALTASLSAQMISVTDGTTPPPIQAGTPTGTYALSGFENVSLYTGQLSFALPLLKVGGRGTAGYQIFLPIQRVWRVENHLNGNQDVFVPLSGDQLTAPGWGTGTVWRYTPGRVVARSIVQGELGGTFSCPGITTTKGYLGRTLTRLTYIEWDGTEHELVDTQLYGQPAAGFQRPTCNVTFNTQTSRGTVFVATDNSALTFAADATIYDVDSTPDPAAPLPSKPVGGWLQFPDGTKYQFDFTGAIQQIVDRNGNYTKFCYANSQSGGCAPTGNDSITITDPLGRAIHVGGNATQDTITYPGYAGASRSITITWAQLGTQTLAQGQTIQAYNSLFPTANGTSSSYQPNVVASVALPDNVSYTFQYNSYGELARVVLPTGGAIEYDYPATMPACTGTSYPYGCTSIMPDPGGNDRDIMTLFRRVMQRRVYPDGATLESRTVFTPSYSPSTPSTAVTAELQDKNGIPVSRTVHYFPGDASNPMPYPLLSPGSDSNGTSPYPVWTDGKEYQTDTWSLEANQVAKSLKNVWGQYPCGTTGQQPCWFLDTQGHTTVTHQPNICQSNTTLQEGSQSLTSGEVRLYDQYSNVAEQYEFDFGSAPSLGTTCPAIVPAATACSAVSGYATCTQSQYAAGYDQPATDASLTQGTPGQNNHIRNLATLSALYDGSGLIAKTQSWYDTQVVLDASGVTNHLPAYGTSFSSGRGNLTAVQKSVNASASITTSAQFDIAGNVLSSTDGNGRATSITYQNPEYAFPLSVCKTFDGKNRCFYRVYDTSSGHLRDHTDFNGTVTHFDYVDGLDRVTRAVRNSTGTPSMSSQTLFSYTNSDTVVTTTSDKDNLNDGQLVARKTVDGLGRLISSLQFEDGNPNGANYISTERTYDAGARPYQVSNPHRPTEPQLFTTTSYDSLGRVIKVVTPDLAATTYSYNNNQTVVTDPAPKSRWSQVDGLGRLTTVVEGQSSLTVPTATKPYQTAYTYNGAGNLLNVHQTGAPNDVPLADRTFSYDMLGRLTQTYNPESGTTRYSGPNGELGYDGDGNLLYKIDANHIETAYSYNEIDKLLQKVYTPLAGAPATYSPTATVQYTYFNQAVANSVGRLTQVSNGNAWNILQYDALGRVAAGSQTTNNATYNFASYSYNLTDALTSITYPSGRVVSTSYDEAARISQVTGSLNGSLTTYASLNTNFATQSYAYAAHGGIQQMALGGLTEQTCYNSRLQATGIRLGSGTKLCTNFSGTSDVLNLVFGYGGTTNNGNLLSETISRGASTWSQSYPASAYDALNRLTAASEGSNWSQTFAYDGYGNRAVTAGVVNAYATPTAISEFSGNRWTFTGVAHDSAGNQTALPGRTYTYDGENRLATTVGPNIGQVNYSYDGEGRRVMKVICPTQSPCTASTSGAKVTVFVYDAQGQLTAEYGTASGTVRTDYLTADQLGSTRVIVDQTGAVLNCYDYYPFGEDIAAGTGGRPGCFGNGAYPGSGPDEASQKFTGKERDWETGLDYFGARYMSSAQGRFTSPDPTFLNIRKVVSPQRWNLYGYALNNPLRYVDPDGEETIAVYYPGYQVGVRNDPKITMPLGHAGVVVVRKDGSTHYFEYGRYHGPVGETRNAGEHNTPTPSLQRDASGKITPDSMKDLLSTLSEASGKSGQVDALVFDTASIEDAVIEAYLNAREQENGDPNRQHYSPYSHNCGTLICEAFDKAGHPGPGSFQRWGLTPGNIFDQLSLMSGPSQQFSYKPKKEKVTSKICYTGDNGKKVCQ